MSDDSAIRIQIALRAAMIAKSALEMMNMDVRLAKAQLSEVVNHVKEMGEMLRKEPPTR